MHQWFGLVKTADVADSLCYSPAGNPPALKQLGPSARLVFLLHLVQLLHSDISKTHAACMRRRNWLLTAAHRYNGGKYHMLQVATRRLPKLMQCNLSSIDKHTSW
jgi:hypothetical protein